MFTCKIPLHIIYSCFLHVKYHHLSRGYKCDINDIKLEVMKQRYQIFDWACLTHLGHQPADWWRTRTAKKWYFCTIQVLQLAMTPKLKAYRKPSSPWPCRVIVTIRNESAKPLESLCEIQVTISPTCLAESPIVLTTHTSYWQFSQWIQGMEIRY